MDGCAHEGAHHSDDRVTVYYGGTRPVLLCGFHAQEPIDFSKVRKGELMIWTLTGAELDRLREALDGAGRLRVAVDEGTFKYAVDGDSWTPGVAPDSR